MKLYKTAEVRIYNLLTASLIPTHFMLALSALLTGAMVLVELQSPAIYPSDLSYITTHIPGYCLVASFFCYAVASLYCSMSISKSPLSRVARYGTAITGVCLWSIVFAAIIVRSLAGTEMLHAVPIAAEAWALIQLLSKIRDTDRRRI